MASINPKRTAEELVVLTKRMKRVEIVAFVALSLSVVNLGLYLLL